MLMNQSFKHARDLTPEDSFEMAGHMLIVMSVDTKPYNRYVTVNARHPETKSGTSAIVHGEMLFTVYRSL